MVSEELKILRKLEKEEDERKKEWEAIEEDLASERYIPNIELNWIVGAIIFKMYIIVGLLSYLMLFKIGEVNIDTEVIMTQLKIFLYISLGEAFLILYQLLLRPIIKWIKNKINRGKK